MRFLRMLYYIWFDTFIVPIFNRVPYWNSRDKKYGTWDDYWFIAYEEEDE